MRGNDAAGVELVAAAAVFGKEKAGFVAERVDRTDQADQTDRRDGGPWSIVDRPAGSPATRHSCESRNPETHAVTPGTALDSCFRRNDAKGKMPWVKTTFGPPCSHGEPWERGYNED